MYAEKKAEEEDKLRKIKLSQYKFIYIYISRWVLK